MAEVVKRISFAELVEARTDEMESVLPGFMTTLTNPNNGNTTIIFSKTRSREQGKVVTGNKKKVVANK